MDPDAIAVRFNARRYYGRWPAIRSPKAFSEMLAAKMLADDPMKLARYADKLAARDEVAMRVGAQHLVPLLAFIDDPQDERIGNLRPPYVLKASHGSGMVKVVQDWNSHALPELRRLMAQWLDFEYALRYRERAYGVIRPRVLVETFLGEGDVLPVDFKVYSFGGKARLVQIITGRGTDTRLLNITPEGRVVLAEKGFPPPTAYPPLPVGLAEMVALAERLAAGLDFVRVDLYWVSNQAYFGEYTLYPGAALTPFVPWEFDIELGRVWSEGRAIAERWLGAQLALDASGHG
jgi:hypothetical protein